MSALFGLILGALKACIPFISIMSNIKKRGDHIIFSQVKVKKGQIQILGEMAKNKVICRSILIHSRSKPVYPSFQGPRPRIPRRVPSGSALLLRLFMSLFIFVDFSIRAIGDDTRPMPQSPNADFVFAYT